MEITRNVTVEKVGGDFTPTETVDYKENTHVFLGGLFEVSVRYIHNDRFLSFTIRLPRKREKE